MARVKEFERYGEFWSACQLAGAKHKINVYAPQAFLKGGSKRCTHVIPANVRALSVLQKWFSAYYDILCDRSLLSYGRLPHGFRPYAYCRFSSCGVNLVRTYQTFITSAHMPTDQEASKPGNWLFELCFQHTLKGLQAY